MDSADEDICSHNMGKGIRGVNSFVCCREFKRILRYYDTMTAAFLLWQSRAYKFLTLFSIYSHWFPIITIIWHTASTSETHITFPTHYHQSIMSSSQLTSISSPQTNIFKVYSIDPCSYHYLVTQYKPALSRSQCAYVLDPNCRSSKPTKRIHHQPGDPIALYPRLIQFDYVGDKIDGVDGLRRMSGDELVERHWYKVHREQQTRCPCCSELGWCRDWRRVQWKRQRTMKGRDG